MPGEVDVVADDHQRAGAVGRVRAAGGVGQDHELRAELPEQQHRLDHEAGVVALVQVEAALEHGDGDAGEAPQQQPARVPGRRGDRPAGQLLEGDRDRVLEVVGEAAETGAQHHADPRHEVRPGADGGDERGEAGRLLGRGDRAGAVDVGHALRIRPRGIAGAAAARSQRRASSARAGSTCAGNFDAREEYRHRDAGHVLPGAQPGRPRGLPCAGERSARRNHGAADLDAIAVRAAGLALR